MWEEKHRTWSTRVQAVPTLRRRLERLEGSCKLPASKSGAAFTDEDWLACFADLGLHGFFAGEPDFPTALAWYREAIEDARRKNPPFDPPPDFQPHMDEKRRRLEWRRTRHYPDVQGACLWLLEMTRRVHDGKPSVTEAEFYELASWFNANDARLYRDSPPSQLLDLGDGRQTSNANIRWAISKGPRAIGAGEVAEQLRLLRARYGEGGRLMGEVDNERPKT